MNGNAAYVLIKAYGKYDWKNNIPSNVYPAKIINFLRFASLRTRKKKIKVNGFTVNLVLAVSIMFKCILIVINDPLLVLWNHYRYDFNAILFCIWLISRWSENTIELNAKHKNAALISKRNVACRRNQLNKVNLIWVWSGCILNFFCIRTLQEI